VATELELLIAGAWARELDREVIGPEEDVFGLGATSLSVMRTFARLKKLLPASATLEIAHLFKGPTPARLAELIHAPIEGSGGNSVVRLTIGQSATPVFLVHPVQGTSTAYFAVRGLLADLEIYAFNNPRLSGENPFTCVEEMASVYVEWVRSIARSRPPIIGGWSFGGLIALEMARQLQAKGGAVPAVVLIDTHGDSAAGDPDTEPAGTESAGTESAGTGSAGTELLGTELLGTELLGTELLGTELDSSERLGAAELHGGLDLLRAEIARNQAMASARAEAPYNGRVVLLRAQQGNASSTDEHDGRCGWPERILPELQVIEVAGTHHDLFSDKYLASTAEAIRAAVTAQLR
jgi:nocardicin nonribosomal peptide synthetase NocB